MEYTKAAVETAGWDVLRGLHRETLRSLKADCKDLDWAGLGTEGATDD